MAEWSDWYAKDDPTKWVLAEVLKRRATETPDREYLKFADNSWVSYGEVNARANRVANATSPTPTAVPRTEPTSPATAPWATRNHLTVARAGRETPNHGT